MSTTVFGPVVGSEANVTSRTIYSACTRAAGSWMQSVRRRPSCSVPCGMFLVALDLIPESLPFVVPFRAPRSVSPPEHLGMDGWTTNTAHLGVGRWNKQSCMLWGRLTFADTFEKFLQNKYNTVKRFGLNGEPARNVCVQGFSAGRGI